MIRDTQGQRNFVVAYYRWAAAQWQRELDGDFPLVRAVRNPNNADVIEIFRALPAPKADRFAQLLVRRAHSEAMKLLEQEFTAPEVSLLAYLDDQRWRAINKRDTLALIEADRKINRRLLRRHVQEAIEPILGTSCNQFGGHLWQYSTPLGEWTIETVIDFSSRRSAMAYHHDIRLGPSMFGDYISAPVWLGIGAGEWSGLSDEDIPTAALGLAFVCRYFMHALRGLLPE
jgi:hypothetical protein